MLKVERTRELLVALLLLGVVLFAPPLLLVFNKAVRILGIPALYLYLFAAWAALIALVALAARRLADTEEIAGVRPEAPGHDDPPTREGPRNA